MYLKDVRLLKLGTDQSLAGQKFLSDRTLGTHSLRIQIRQVLLQFCGYVNMIELLRCLSGTDVWIMTHIVLI